MEDVLFSLSPVSWMWNALDLFQHIPHTCITVSTRALTLFGMLTCLINTAFVSVYVCLFSLPLIC